MSANKKETWKFIIQTAIAILTAIATSLLTSSLKKHVFYN